MANTTKTSILMAKGKITTTKDISRVTDQKYPISSYRFTQMKQTNSPNGRYNTSGKSTSNSKDDNEGGNAAGLDICEVIASTQ